MISLKRAVYATLLLLTLTAGSCAHRYLFTAPQMDFNSYQKTGCQSVTGSPSGITEDQLIAHVDPFMGTAGHGHTFPGATLPFGMVQVSPDNGYEGWDWCSGYHWYSDRIDVISHKHLSGTGIGDLGDIGVMPSLSGRIAMSSFSHENEYAHPGYYAVRLDNGILIELTATERAAVHRYRYPAGKKQWVRFDLAHGVGWDRPVKGELEQVDDHTVVGYRYSRGWADHQRVWFAAQFDRPVASASLKGMLGKVRFDGDSNQLVMKLALSSVSRESALANLEAEVKERSFNQTKQEAESKWEAELSKIRIESASESDLKTFYGSLYHAYIAPNLISDADGRYREPDGSITQTEGYNRYSTFSLWDTFRATHPLFVLTQPEKTVDFVESLLDHYDQRGVLPVWELEANDNFCMVGNHAVPVIVEAWLKGIRGFDIEKAYEACKASLMQDFRSLDHYRELGYVPYDKEWESVSKTLEYAYNDWTMAKLASALGREEDAAYFEERSTFYRNTFDRETGLMRPRHSDGSWLDPFDPFTHKQGLTKHYTEGNAWQYNWFVPHDVEGLIGLYENPESFLAKLNQLFDFDASHASGKQLVDVTGLIGQYAHGNEPSHHVAYLYNWTDEPWRGQELINRVCSDFYSERPDGYCGNEDCGQMSAWYIFSAMGFYPVDPASATYQLGSPRLKRAEIELGGGKRFIMEAENAGAHAPYIQKVSLNGKLLDRLYITHEELISGGTLSFVMGERPVQ